MLKSDKAGRERNKRQLTVNAWGVTAFGYQEANSVAQRGIRLAEEAIEAAQACGCSAEMVHRMVDYVYSRPSGELAQELGGVGITLLALAEAARLSADDEEARELLRVLSKPISHFIERNISKNNAGFKADGIL